MDIKFNADGLVPVIAQDVRTKEVLQLAYMNQEAFDKTIETGKVHYFSRSRQKLWLKGETSGHFQLVKKIMFDCDNDALLVWIEQVGSACHTGSYSCFFNSYDDSVIEHTDILSELYGVIQDRKLNPKDGSYTNYLFEKGLDKILKKVGEETSEVIIASKNKDKTEITNEISDLMYHLSVLMVERGVGWEDIFAILKKRR